MTINSVFFSPPLSPERTWTISKRRAKEWAVHRDKERDDTPVCKTYGICQWAHGFFPFITPHPAKSKK